MRTGVVLADWLARAPDGELPIGSRAAGKAVKALVGGWSTHMLRALAAKPLSLTELDRAIAGVNYPSLERRLNAMRAAGQVVAAPARKSRPYRVTDWMREAVAPLIASVRWEQGQSLETCDEVGRLDIETVLFFLAPRLELPEDVDGVCRMEVGVPDQGEHPAAAVVLTIAEGRLGSCRVDPDGVAPSRVSGPMAAWLDALTTREEGDLDIDGDRDLAEALILAMQSALRGPGLLADPPAAGRTGR